MTGLVDTPIRHDLAESTCPEMHVREIGGWESLADRGLGYGSSRGDGELRRLIGADTGVAPEHVLVTAGAAAAMYLLAQDRCHGRTVLVRPCYPPALLGPRGLGSPVDTVTLHFDDGYRLRSDAMAEVVTPQTRLVSLASPQNPSGVRFTTGELVDLVAVLEDRAPHAVLLVDETYRACTYGAASVPPSAAGLSPRVVTCSSLSKAHGAPGLRLGWLTTTDPALYERLRAAKFATSIACAGVDEFLGRRLLARQADVLAPRAGFLGRALDRLEAWTATQPVDFLRPDGGALCCLRLPEHRFGSGAVRAFYAELAARETRVAPGSWFGEDDRVFRVGFGHLPAGAFAEALARLAEAHDASVDRSR